VIGIIHVKKVYQKFCLGELVSSELANSHLGCKLGREDRS
jgi:hypothetical protein